MAYALQTIAKKTNTPNNWYAWIPILNIYLMCVIANKPIYWILLLLIPLVNIIIAVLLWMAIAKKLNLPEYYGILIIIPLVGFYIIGVMAFSDNKPQNTV